MVCVCACVWMWEHEYMAHMWWSEDSFQESVLSFQGLNSQVIRFVLQAHLPIEPYIILDPKNTVLMRDILREVADQSERLGRWKSREKFMSFKLNNKENTKQVKQRIYHEKEQYPSLHAKPTIQIYTDCNLSPLHEKRGQANSQTKSNFNYNKK